MKNITFAPIAFRSIAPIRAGFVGVPTVRNG
jgi:hypothetical protein